MMSADTSFGAQAPDTEGPDPMVEMLRVQDPEDEVNPGTRAGDALRIMTEVPATPTGCLHLPRQVYGTAGPGGRPLSMHLFAREDPTERRPAVVLIHGGAWREGRAEWLLWYAHHLAAAGFVTASIRYRLQQEAKWPAALEDAKCAVRWMRTHAGEIGLDPDRIAVAGGSAGGHLATLVASTPGRFEGSGGHPDVPSGADAVFLWYPMTDALPAFDVPPLRDVLVDFFGTDSEGVAREASPLTYASEARPTETVCGDLDPFYQLGIVQTYHQELDRHAIPNRLLTVEGAGHSFDYDLERWAWCAERLEAFVRRQLGFEVPAET